MEIQVLGAHSLEAADTRLTSLLIDGVLALDAGSLATGLSFSAQQALKAILLTHQHYDHVRDIPMIGMSFAAWGRIRIYSIPAVFEALSSHLLNDKLYPNFLEWPKQRPSVEFITLEIGKTEVVENYAVLALPVNHPVPTVGFQITSPQGKKLFYTGDTGAGLSACWESVSPDLLIIEVTITDYWEKMAQEAGHLTPSLLKQELVMFRQMKGYLPPVLVVHISPFMEKEIREELTKVALELGVDIRVGQEGMKVTL